MASVNTFGHPRWEITLLGSFNVLHEGRPISLPISLAVQALKIVALRKRISVDELVELLWPDAPPGVGNRRLRNVLWRNRVSCGDLLYRDGNFICLAKEAVVDADRFRAAAERAIEAGATNSGTELVREALALYPGELLPGDHYVDWPTARRESLAGLYMSLLDLLLDHAIEDGQTHEALGFLDRLIDADPYEERHYVRAAELHAASGNMSRAMATLSRADRTLTDLGVGPSPMVEQVRQRLAS
jgi:DNA-binding SARP family transcriptional activator